MYFNNNTVNVFPITSDAFGLPTNWFWSASPRLIQPSYLLMVVFLILAVGIMALKRFENANLEKKLWNIPVLVIAIAFWPNLVFGLKNLVDSFNTFLVDKVFDIPWNGFGYPEVGGVSNILWWSAEAFARLIPNLAYWIIYSFYMIFVFFFALLGPIVLAKGILTDEIDTLLEIIGEITILFLWQTMMVILVGIIMPEIVSMSRFPDKPDENFYFQSIILGIMIFFIPSITKKFAHHFGSTLVPPVYKSLMAYTGIGLLGKAGGLGMAALRIPKINAPRVLAAHAHGTFDTHKLEREKNNLENQQRSLARREEDRLAKHSKISKKNRQIRHREEAKEKARVEESFVNLAKKAQRDVNKTNDEEKK